MRILGIESSCDETAAAVVTLVRGRCAVLSSVIASQVETHAKTGGVVPEVAAREHVGAIMPVIEQALADAKLSLKKIDAIAVTRGPGLITSLRIGVDVARILSYLLKKPLVGVNHLEGHLYASWLPSVNRPVRSVFRFPILTLIVSGGHTELVLMRKHLQYRVLGVTRDDAAGEVFDKVAKMLDLGYPGGPAVSKLAFEGNSQAIVFPRPMIDSDDFDFSFAGLKTAVRYHIQKLKSRTRAIDADICASFEQAVVDVLVAKTIRAAKKYKVTAVLLGGGVAANRRLREELGEAVKKELPKVSYEPPDLAYTTDNAAMIAAAGAFHAQAKHFTVWNKLEADPNLGL